MIEIFNTISNIAEHIEKEVFKNYDNFTNYNSDEEIHEAVYAYCTKVIKRELLKTRSAKKIISKDTKEPEILNEKGKYIITYVSIDNIDLLDVNFSLGSIFTIYENELSSSHLKAAIYTTYGPTFQLVFASATEGVKFFSFEKDEFVQEESFVLKESGNINSTAGGFPKEWTPKHKELVNSFFNDGYRLRFSDSLALDTHQILFKRGGVYTSPKTASNPDGVLELYFEAMPVSFIIEQAGGESINDKGERILDLDSDSLHTKTPLYFGSKNEIKRVKEYLNN